MSSRCEFPWTVDRGLSTISYLRADSIAMPRALLLLFVISFTSSLYGQHSVDSLINELYKTIDSRDKIQSEKLKRIDSYKSELNNASANKQYELYQLLYSEYKSFIYDSAFTYAGKLLSMAHRLGDPVKIAEGKIKLSFVLVSSGLFKEAIDTLQTIRLERLPRETRVDYFYLMARTNYDLADFDADNFYSRQYTSRGNVLMDSAIALSDEGSTQFLWFTGLNNVRLHNMSAARDVFEKMMKLNLTDQEIAVVASTLSFTYFYSDQRIKAKEMLIIAAIADIRSSTKETLAMLNLADMLYKEGDIENAYNYVKIAMDDANFYGARHRKIQVAAVFPIIEGQRLSTVESQRRALILYASVITVLTILVVIFFIIIRKQFRKLKEADKIISEANHQLHEANHQLMDANKIKEEYVWYYFTVTADHIGKLDGLKKSLDLKLLTKKQDDIRFIVDSINIKRERDELYHNFDRVFLKLFPNFIEVFNSFFKEEDRIHLKEDQLMNTELRIFALIRMGIHDNEKIAKILDYSVTTIYTYKTRIRSKSILENDNFDRQIMNIRAI